MEIKEAIEKNDLRWNEIVKEKYMSRTDYTLGLKTIEARRKKEIKILTKAMLDLNKTISKMKKQEDFLNELLDEKIEVQRLHPNLKNGK